MCVTMKMCFILKDPFLFPYLKKKRSWNARRTSNTLTISLGGVGEEDKFAELLTKYADIMHLLIEFADD